MYITKDDTTEDYFRRFKTITLDKKPWEVNAVDALSTEGIIRVLLKEDYSNTVAEEIAEEKEENAVIETSLIQGPIEVYPYDTVQYTIDKTGGSWELNSTKATIIEQSETTVKVAITSGRSGAFELIYKKENEEDIVLKVTINSL